MTDELTAPGSERAKPRQRQTAAKSRALPVRVGAWSVFFALKIGAGGVIVAVALNWAFVTAIDFSLHYWTLNGLKRFN